MARRESQRDAGAQRIPEHMSRATGLPSQDLGEIVGTALDARTDGIGWDPGASMAGKVDHDYAEQPCECRRMRAPARPATHEAMEKEERNPAAAGPDLPA